MGVLAVSAAVILAVLIVGIRRADRRHLANAPRSHSEEFARRLLLGIRYPGIHGIPGEPARERIEVAGEMSRAAEIIAVTYVVRHCNEYGCRKCIARARWNRRKRWQSRKNSRRATGRK